MVVENMEKSKDLGLISKCFFAGLIGISIYALKLPGESNFPVYRILYLIMWILIPVHTQFKGSSLRMTQRCWCVLSVWGCLLLLSYGVIYEMFLSLTWAITFATECTVLSYLLQSENKRLFLYRIFAFFSMGIAVSGIYESLTGYYYHETVSSYQYVKNVYGFYRPNTIFYNVNDNAIFMLFCYLVMQFYPNSKEAKFVKITSLLLFGGNILMVDSRGAELALVAYLLLFYLMQKFKKHFTRVFVLALLLTLPFSAMIISLDFFALENRPLIWAMSLHSLAETLYLGVGPGQIVQANMDVDGVTAVHNFFLEMFCNYGLVGLFSLLVWYFSLMKNSYKLFKLNIENRCLPILCAFLFASITCSSLEGKVFPITFFGFLIAEMNRAEKQMIYRIF